MRLNNLVDKIESVYNSILTEKLEIYEIMNSTPGMYKLEITKTAINLVKKISFPYLNKNK
jgi:hypothetical protein